MRKLLFVLPLFAVALWFTSCDNTAERERLERERADSIRMADSMERVNVEAEAARERDEYRTRYNTEMDSMQRQIDEMDAKMEKQGGKAKAEWQETKADLKARMARVKARMETAGDKADENFDAVKTDLDTAVDNIRQGWNKAMEKLKVDKK